MISIYVSGRKTRESLSELTAQTSKPRVLLQNATRAARRVLLRHFAERDKTPNQLGGRRTHFWADVRKSTQIGEVTNERGVVIIGDSRFAQRVYGGTIRAKEAKALTIPLVPEAHGLRAGPIGASQFEREARLKLFLVRGRSGAFLATRPGMSIQIRPTYKLTPSVWQDADPEALPPMKDISDAAVDAARDALNVQLRDKTT